MVDEEGLEQNVVEETTSLTKEAELEDLDKPEPVEEDNKKEPVEGEYEINLAGILKPNEPTKVLYISRAEIKKFFVHFLVQVKIARSPFKIN